MTQAGELLTIASQAYEFGADAMTAIPFGRPQGGPNVAYPLRGSALSLRSALADAYYSKLGEVPSSKALTDAITVIEGKSRAGARTQVHLRVAARPDQDLPGVLLDLGRPDGWTVVIDDTVSSWHVAERSSVTFGRTVLTAGLPDPVDGGDLAQLRDLINVSDKSWPLLVGWLLAALTPNIPYPTGLFTGEQGTGKTTAARMLVSLIDPSPVPVRAAPSNVNDWVTAASGSWIVAIDNISTISGWLSDALCRAATGEGLVRRQLYTDSDLAVIQLQRPVLLTSIDPGALRGDLADRLVTFELDTIPATDRQLDSDLRDVFTAQHPAILGGLLDLFASVRAELTQVRLDELPRMADFARILAALDRVWGTDALGTYLGLGDALAGDIIDSDPVAAAIVTLVANRGAWQGSASELHTAITPVDKAPKDWPANAKALSGMVKRIAPALRQVGLHVDFDRNGSKRTITLARTDGDGGRNRASRASSASSAQATGGFDGGGSATPSASSVPFASYGASPPKPPLTRTDDARDANDAPNPAPSPSVVDTGDYEDRYPDLFAPEEAR